MCNPYLLEKLSKLNVDDRLREAELYSRAHLAAARSPEWTGHGAKASERRRASADRAFFSLIVHLGARVLGR